MSRYAYLHGFASSPSSHKGMALAEAFAARGLGFERPDLNRPSFARLDSVAMLAAVDEMDAVPPGDATEARPRWCLVGSSLGGWLAARWAQLHPERVERLVLLCPGFDLAERWPVLLGPDRMAQWEREGAIPFADAGGRLVDLHWGFVEALRSEPGAPEVPCPTLIIHGVHDDSVPIEHSRRYAADRAHVRLLEVDDDHSLAGSLERVVGEVLRAFEIPA
ncbi:YqiA/YcfP family alpha/beta fold hydrolase [Haliangium sp.]|uniref:YqiA/YcfP family alpha/beta fold hydrolase n=1 Tax=Haliangium sp. TaxID=2663208 RepID=UPI003D0AB2FB